MPFESLPSRLGPIPEFHPLTPPTPPVVNTSGMVKDMIEGIGQAVNYWSPFEQEKRRMEMRALKVRKMVYDDYEKHPDSYEVLPNGGFRKKDDTLHAYQVMLHAKQLQSKDMQIEAQKRNLKAMGMFDQMRQMAFGNKEQNNSVPLPRTDLIQPFGDSTDDMSEDTSY